MSRTTTLINPRTGRPLSCEATLVMRVMMGLNSYGPPEQRGWPGGFKPYAPSIERRIEETLVKAGLARVSGSDLWLTPAGRSMLEAERAEKQANWEADEAARRAKHQAEEEARRKQQDESERITRYIAAGPEMAALLEKALPVLDTHGYLDLARNARAVLKLVKGEQL